MGLFLSKNHLNLLNWIGALTLSPLVKLPPRKLEPWFALWNFFLLRLLCVSINWPCSHAWNTVVISGLVFLVATWDYWISYKNGYCRTGPWLAASLEPLAHCQIVASFVLFGSSELGQLVPFPYSWGRCTHYSDRLHDFSVTIPRCYKHFYVNSFFPHTARPWNSLPMECFPLTYDLNV